jgi:hypothetical protein
MTGILTKAGARCLSSENNLGYHSKRTFSMKWTKTDLRVSPISILDILALLPYMKLVKLCQILIANPFLEPIRIDQKTEFKACGLRTKTSRISD